MDETTLNQMRGMLIGVRSQVDMMLRVIASESDGAEPPKNNEPDPAASAVFGVPQSEDI